MVRGVLRRGIDRDERVLGILAPRPPSERWRRRARLVVVLAVLGMAGMAGLVSTTGLPFQSGSTATPHVMVVMMENKNFSEVIGQTGSEPFTNSLAQQYGLATQSYGFGHPSLPNYLDFVSGSNQGVTDDNPPSSHSFTTVRTLADQLQTAGISHKAYAENLPADPTNDSGEYAVRHFPWEYFPSTQMPTADASSLIPDLNSVSAPSFVWYTPNLINDEHDGSVQQGDAFLSSFIPSVQATAWYRAGGQIIVEWDEADTDNSGINGGGGGHVPTIVISDALKAAPRQSSTPVNTAGILSSVEDCYGLAHLNNDPANGNIDSLLSNTATSPSTTTTTTTVPGSGGSSPALGLFVNSQNPPDVQALASQLGINVQAMGVYANGGSSYNSYSSPPSTSLQLVLGVGNVSAAQATAVGQTLVSTGHSNADIRIMWELNGNWFQWGQQNLSAAQQISAYCTAADAFAAVPGNSFTLTWNVNAGSASPGRNEFDAWPGGACRVDHFGIDEYDGTGMNNAVLNDIAFAKNQGVPVEIDEWGLGGSDDPAYIDFMSGVVHDPTNDVVLASYFSYAGSIDSDITQFPNSMAELTKDFGGSAPSPTTTTTTAPSTTTTTTGPPSTTTTTAPSATTTTTTAPSATTTTTGPPSPAGPPSPTAITLSLMPDAATAAEKITGTIAPVPDSGSVEFTVDGSHVGDIPVSSEDGTAVIEVDMLTGSHIVVATYSGSGEFAASAASTSVDVAQASTNLVVSPPAQIGSGEVFSLHATLSSGNAPISGALVWFAAAGTELCQGTTDGSGNVSCTVAEGESDQLALATNGDSATFGGDPTHLPAVAHSPVTRIDDDHGGDNHGFLSGTAGSSPTTSSSRSSVSVLPSDIPSPIKSSVSHSGRNTLRVSGSKDTHSASGSSDRGSGGGSTSAPAAGAGAGSTPGERVVAEESSARLFGKGDSGFVTSLAVVLGVLIVGCLGYVRRRGRVAAQMREH